MTSLAVGISSYLQVVGLEELNEVSQHDVKASNTRVPLAAQPVESLLSQSGNNHTILNGT